jgi:hypothetical protein
MNKINIILSTLCAFTVINNSFGMLTKAKQKISTYKNIKASAHTKQPQYVCSFNVGDQEDLLRKIIQQNNENNDLAKKNNALLEENNYLLRTILKMQSYAHPLPSEKTLRTPYIAIHPIRIQCGLELHEDFRMLRDIYNIQAYHYKDE